MCIVDIRIHKITNPTLVKDVAEHVDSAFGMAWKAAAVNQKLITPLWCEDSETTLKQLSIPQHSGPQQ